MVRVADLAPHPLNREFPTKGPEWEDFVSSVRSAGRILVPLHVWADSGDGMMILAGHRRAKGAELCGLVEVPCILHKMDEVEALGFLVNENLQRQELNPVDEARLLAAMRDEMELSEMEISERISRSVEWVRTRQLMLQLGDEVLSAVRETHPDKHLSLGAVVEILKVPEDWREEAVQLVLYPDFEVRPLGPDAARDVIRKCVLEPRAAEKAWNGGLVKVVAEWRKRLLKQLGKDEQDGFQVRGIEWAAREGEERGTVAAEDVVAEVEKSSEAPVNLTWLRLAAKHGLAVKVLPGPAEAESVARVDARLLRLAEQALGEHGGKPWLLVDGKEKAKPEAQVTRALAACEGEVEHPEMTEAGEKPQVVIEQGMKHAAWIDMGAVKKLAMWAVSSDADPKTAPDFVPQWARGLAYGGYWNEIDQVCNWVISLKGKSAE